MFVTYLPWSHKDITTMTLYVKGNNSLMFVNSLMISNKYLYEIKLSNDLNQ
jgi:hypothetical protein